MRPIDLLKQALRAQRHHEREVSLQQLHLHHEHQVQQVLIQE